MGHFFRGTTSEFMLRQFDSMTALLDTLKIDNTLFIGFNPGFGSGYDKLVLSWCLDILQLVHLNYRVVFTQANDFSDLRGETRVFEKVFANRVKYFIEAEANPFRAMTHYTDGDEQQGGTWCCANTHLYGI